MLIGVSKLFVVCEYGDEWWVSAPFTLSPILFPDSPGICSRLPVILCRINGTQNGWKDGSIYCKGAERGANKRSAFWMQHDWSLFPLWYGEVFNPDILFNISSSLLNLQQCNCRIHPLSALVTHFLNPIKMCAFQKQFEVSLSPQWKISSGYCRFVLKSCCCCDRKHCPVINPIILIP